MGMLVSVPENNPFWAFFPLCGLGLLLLTACLPFAGQDSKDSSKPKHDEVSFSLGASDNAGAKEVGLPIYPGSRPHKDNSQDNPAAQLWAWGGNSGFKFVVVKLDSEDAPDKVATFYRKALAKYGDVLDCSTGAGKASNRDRNPARQPGCDDNPKAGEWELKAGTKDDQHIVGIEPNGSGSIFQLVHVQTRRSEE
jgi:hypothetical protein